MLTEYRESMNEMNDESDDVRSSLMNRNRD